MPEPFKPSTVAEGYQKELDTLKTENKALREQLDTALKSLAVVEPQLAKLATDREDLAQLKKQVKEDAAEVHREERAMEVEKVRWQRELGDARDELEDAKATMLKQGNKIRELERGYSLKPNPAESRMRLEIGNLQAELEAYKQQPATELELPEPADLLNQLKGRRKKSKADLADVEAILEILEALGSKA
jgi:chromosome segregation ATPase